MCWSSRCGCKGFEDESLEIKQLEFDYSPEEIERRISEWHDSDSKLQLHEYLGISWDDYEKFVVGPHIISTNRGKATLKAVISLVDDLESRLEKGMLNETILWQYLLEIRNSAKDEIKKYEFRSGGDIKMVKPKGGEDNDS